MKIIKFAVVILNGCLLAGCLSSSSIDSNDPSLQGVHGTPSLVVSKPFVANANVTDLESQLKGAYAGSEVQILRVGNEIKVTYPSDVLFGVGGEEILADSPVTLKPIVSVVKIYPGVKLRIDSFTDKSGSPEKNMTRSQARAQAIDLYLIDNGVLVENMSFKGYGSDYPVASNDTAEGRALNRRVVITISKVPAPQAAV